MKKRFFAAILLVAAVAYACTSTEEPMKVDKGFANDGSIVANPTATIADFVLDGPATKTVLAIDESTGATFTFANEDILGVYPYNPLQGDQVRFTVKAQDASSCTFNGSGYALESGQKYAAYYPGDLANADKAMMTKIPVDYSTQAQAALNTFDISAADYLVANGIEPADGVCNFKMSHLGTLLVMDVTPAVAGTYKLLCIDAVDANFIVKGTVDLTQEITVPNDGTPAQGITITPVNESNEVGLTLGGETGLALEAGTTYRFCMMIAPVDMTGKSLTLYLANGDEFISAPIAAKNFKQGYAYKIEAAPAVPVSVINLSASGTANCYIVSEAGDYCFDASVAGNGTEGIVKFPSAYLDAGGLCVPASETCAISGSGVKLHWAQNSCISDVTYSDGIISFKASGSKGNAKLSLTSGANGTGDNVWTWIIWCTDQPGTVTYNAPSSPCNEFTVLDRNIGAITNGPIESGHSAEEMAGLYYQWGNPIGYTAAEFLSMKPNDAWRMVDAFNNPTKPLTRTSDWVWFNPYAGSVGAEVMGSLWGGGQQASFLGIWPSSSSYKKTIYDPCPAGYKVASPDFLREYNDTNDDWYSCPISADCYGMYIQGNDGTTVFFPYTGRIGFTGTTATSASWLQNPFTWPAGDNGYGLGYWTCGIAGDGNRGANIAWTWEGSQRNETRISYGKTTSTNKFVSQGNAVRCIAD